MDDDTRLPGRSWAAMYFEDGQRLIVRLEVPGLEKRIRITDRKSNRP
ncbi:hypothetical protein [Allochromatium tepidum]|nr:hypothetical protein [Allochromatium tepidum]